MTGDRVEAAAKALVKSGLLTPFGERCALSKQERTELAKSALAAADDCDRVAEPNHHRRKTTMAELDLDVIKTQLAGSYLDIDDEATFNANARRYVRELVDELERTEGDLAVAVREAQRARETLAAISADWQARNVGAAPEGEQR